MTVKVADRLLLILTILFLAVTPLIAYHYLPPWRR
jgi:hypothetical protein